MRTSIVGGRLVLGVGCTSIWEGVSLLGHLFFDNAQIWEAQIQCRRFPCAGRPDRSARNGRLPRIQKLEQPDSRASHICFRGSTGAFGRGPSEIAPRLRLLPELRCSALRFSDGWHGASWIRMSRIGSPSAQVASLRHEGFAERRLALRAARGEEAGMEVSRLLQPGRRACGAQRVGFPFARIIFWGVGEGGTGN